MRHHPFRRTPNALAGADLPAAGVPAYRVRVRWRLTRQDTRSALVARRYGALGVLMSAAQLDDVTVPAVTRTDAGRTARVALDVLWRTLHRDAARRTAHWNPGVAHVRQASDLHRWSHTATRADVAALLIVARRAAADELDAARTRRRELRTGLASAVASN